VNEQLLQYLLANQGTTKFLVATTGSMSAAPLIIATGKPVIAMGGFSGSDPVPTVEGLQKLVESGQLRYVLLGGGPGGGGPGGIAPRGGNQRIDWVRSSCTPVATAARRPGVAHSSSTTAPSCEISHERPIDLQFRPHILKVRRAQQRAPATNRFSRRGKRTW
jgi:hypothetical protein